MKILKEYKENGYIFKEYENGMVIKELIDSKENILKIENTVNEHLDDEDFKTKMILDIEYLKCLAEINGGM